MPEVPKTILLKGAFRDNYDEGTAGGTITPGHLLKLSSTLTLVVHATSGGFGESLFAIEDALQGKLISDNYTSGNLVRYIKAQPGMELYCLLPAAAAAVTKGDYLISNGDGTLIKTTGTPSKIFATALETVNNSGGGTPARIKVRIH